jgi:hypothetical protein
MSARSMEEAALRLLEGLTDDQRSLVHLPFDDARREIWMYWPREMTDDSYPGVGIHRLTFEQRQLAMRLVATGIDWATLGQIAAIMALDYPLDARERYTRTALRDPNRYWITIFGDPAASGTWSWQFEGHHVAINHVVIDGQVASSTPLFLGANPARIRKGHRFVSRPCGPEEDAGRALLASLTGDLRERAILAAPAPIDLVVHRLSQVPDVARPGSNVHPLGTFQDLFASLSDREKDALTLDLAAPVGVARRELGPEQKALIDDLIELYVHRLPEAMATSELARLEAAGLDDIHFAWAGADTEDEPHYYRLQGPTFLVEYDCVQDGANHVHTVWRDPKRDFGRDPLRHHLATRH